MWLQIKKLKISPVVLAAILVGGGLILVIVISLCTYLCCCRKDGKGKRVPQENTLENPPEAKGKDHGRPARQSEQQNNSPRIARPSVASALPPSAAGTSASSLQKPPIRSPKHLPVESSMSSSITGSSLEVHVSKQSLTPQWAPPSTSHSIGSENSNLSGHESLMPPPSPVPSFGSSQTMFSYRDLAMATNNFSEANQLGQGGFGFVHKGLLPNGKAIAVKSLKANSKQGEREFQAEIETISRVHHRHLVSLVGYCITGSRRLLVYEYVPNNTLVFHLHGKGKPTMNWSIRMKVAVGVAKGLAYLHEDCDPKIIHRDIKAANILLDNNFLAKVADFGLAKFSSKEVTHVSTRVMGTLGYLAPEYASTGKLTEKSDVYSFGVLLLELVTGRRPVDKTKEVQNLVQWARPLLTRAIDIESFDYLVDPRLQNNYDHNEMLRIVACAATCVRTSARRRPLMSQVVRALEGNIELSDITEGITPGYSSAHDYGTGSEYSSSSQYTDWRDFDSTGVTVSTVEYISSEHDVISSEYGLNPSDSSSQSQPQTTQELDTEEINRVRRRLQIS